MSLKDRSMRVLECIKSNPGATVNDLSDILTKTDTKEDVSQALWSLWVGRYVSRVRSATKRSATNSALFEYTFKTVTPRKRPHKNGAEASKEVKHKPTVEIMVAIKGMKDTLVMTATQAREMMEQLKQLGL